MTDFSCSLYFWVSRDILIYLFKCDKLFNDNDKWTNSLKKCWLRKKNVLIAIIMYINFLTFYIASLFLEL